MGKSEFPGLDSFWWDMPILAKPSILKQEKWRLFRRRGDLSLRRAKWWEIEWNKVWITEEGRLVSVERGGSILLPSLTFLPMIQKTGYVETKGSFFFSRFPAYWFYRVNNHAAKTNQKMYFYRQSESLQRKIPCGSKMHNCNLSQIPECKSCILV